MFKKAFFVLLSALAFLASGCGKEEQTKILLSQTEVKLLPGDTFKLEVSIEPSSSVSSLQWSSLNPSVVTVEDGLLTAVSAGETYVIATVGHLSKGCLVTVNDRELPGYDDSEYEWKD